MSTFCLVLFGVLPIFNRHLAIVLPSQSIVVEKDFSEPITRRQLSFADLISHLKHHNSGIWKSSLYFFSRFCIYCSYFYTDAILGLQELLESHRDLLQSSLTNLVNVLVRVIADEVHSFFTFDSLLFKNGTGCIRSQKFARFSDLVITKNSISMSLISLMFFTIRQDKCHAVGRS